MSSILNQFLMNYFRLDKEVAIVTGRNAGIGQAYAAALVKAGVENIN